jgi:ubiquinone/menaquinone biosynthesis C-methylase UbiE
VDLLANLESLPFATSSIDMVWCHHVLEHVEHDRVAIGELYRVLCPRTGELLVSVPTEPGTMTREYGFANKRESGHWRMYGDDFPERLMESGFDAQSVNYAPSQDDCRKYGITQERFYICRKNQIAGAIKV